MARRGHGGGIGPVDPVAVLATAQVPRTWKRRLIRPADDRGVFVLLGAPVPFRVAYTLMFLGSTAYLVAACVKWYGQMRGLDRGRT